MRVIKITKTVNGPNYHYMIFEDDISDDLITYEAEDWCTNDPNGQSRGYSWKWEEVTEPVERRDIVEKNIKNLIGRIDRLTLEHEKLKAFFETL